MYSLYAFYYQYIGLRVYINNTKEINKQNIDGVHCKLIHIRCSNIFDHAFTFLYVEQNSLGGKNKTDLYTEKSHKNIKKRKQCSPSPNKCTQAFQRPTHTHTFVVSHLRLPRFKLILTACLRGLFRFLFGLFAVVRESETRARRCKLTRRRGCRSRTSG